jgi:hypothetical protein
VTPERHVTLRSGEQVLIRPIRPDDEQRLLDAFERMSPESRYRRFFTATPRPRRGAGGQRADARPAALARRRAAPAVIGARG